MLAMFQKYLHWKHEESKASTAIAYYQTAVEYFSYHQLRINQYNQRRDITMPKDPKNMRHAITIPEIRKLVDYSKPQRKALYTVLVSSGMRIGETLGLRKRDFDFTQDRICITIPARLTKVKMQRQTYISKEAEHYLLPIIKRKNQDDLVFSKNSNNKKSVNNEVLNFWNLRKKAELDEKYDDSTYHKISLHSFRSFFETQASNTHGLEYAYALIGHSGYLEQYYRLDSEDRLEKYMELEPKLTINDDFRNKIKIQKLEIEKTELQKIKEDNVKLREDNEKIMAWIARQENKE